MPIFMMEVTKKLKDEELYWLEKRQPWFDPQQLKALRDGHLAASFVSAYSSRSGIQRVFIWKSLKPKGYIFFSMLINLQALALGRTSIDLFTGTRQTIAKLRQGFTQEIWRIMPIPESAELMNWSISQVQYSMDIETPHVVEYGKLFKRVCIPAGFSGAYISADEIYIDSQSKCVRFELYEKIMELNDRYSFSGRAKMIRNAQNHLRIAVNCSGDKLYDIRRTFSPGTHKLSPEVFLDQNVANTVLQEFYRQIIGYADFHSLPKALHMVEASPWRQDRKDNLSSFLHLLNESETVGTAMKEFLAGTKLKKTGEVVQGSQRALEYYMNEYLPELNIHPILLPTKRRRSLPNPMPVDVQI